MPTMVDEPSLETATWVTSHRGSSDTLNLRRCRLEVVAGPDHGKVVEVAQPTIHIGRSDCDLQLSDPKVSGVHCELRLGPEGYRLRDLESTNGTYVRGVRIVEAYLAPGATIGVGKSAITLTPLDDAVALPLWTEPRLCGLIGESPAMRRLFELIDRFAVSDATVLILGETGSGKELVADAIHQRSPRARGPFQVLDCSAIPEHLVEDQLFGHEAGSFTGAGRQVIGVFEAAHGGTLFLDEIGELPLEAQGKLLRAVETHKIRRIGGMRAIDCDVRIVAATHRDLAAHVNRGMFRADLYYRLAVARLEVPPLRERREDVPLLIDHFARQAGSGSLPPDFVERAQRHDWPGNVRELKNAVERALLLPRHPHRFEVTAPSRGNGFPTIDLGVPFKDAKQALVDEFDRRYLAALLAAHDGNISAAARTAQVDRMSIYKMMRRLGLDEREVDDEEPTGTR